MKLNIKLIASAVLLASGLVSVAQNTRSAYFTEGYLYRYQQNPAFANERNFISLPAFGNINFGVNGDLRLDDILYNIDGKTTTFLNPAVNANDFLDAIGDKTRFGSDFKLGLLAVGFKGFNGYNTISINARTNVQTHIPNSLFALMKEGIENKVYDISDFRAHADAYLELALGHSHKINEKLRVGATVKFLVGGANIDADFNKAHLALGEDSWDIVVDGQIQSSVKGLEYTHSRNTNTGHEYVDGIDVDDDMGINGFGVAFDLGAEYKLNKDWSFSASVVDLGFIKWDNNMLASTNGEKAFKTGKYSFNVDEDMDNGFDNEMDKIQDDLSALYELEDMGDQGALSKMLAATINVGVQYNLPVYRKLSFGLLNTTRLQGDYTWTEFRLSANVNPIKAFSAGANVVTGTFGWGFGWIMNLNVPGFNIFMGMDHMMTKLAKQGIPMTANANVNFGINIPF